MERSSGHPLSAPTGDAAALRQALEVEFKRFAVESGRLPRPAEIRRLLLERGITALLVDEILAVAPPTGPLTASTGGPTSPTDAASASGKRPPQPQDARPAPVAQAVVTPAGEDEDWWSTDEHHDVPAFVATGDSAVDRAVMDLLQDWERRGRRLDVDEVTILVRKRTLTAGAHARILATLTDLGVLDDPEDSLQMPVRLSKRGQPRFDDAIAVFLHDVSSRPLIRAEDEVRLGRSIQAARLARQQLLTPTNPEDRSALELVIQRGLQAHAQLVEANLRLVVSIAKKSGLGNDLAFEDRIQCGNLGLLRAADKFDPELGYKFSTYATWWIRQAISRGNADTGRAIRLPVHAHETLSKLRTARRRLERSGRNDPSLTDVATEARIDVAYARALTDWAHDLVSLDQPLAEGDITLVDFYADRTAHPDDEPDHYSPTRRPRRPRRTVAYQRPHNPAVRRHHSSTRLRDRRPRNVGLHRRRLGRHARTHTANPDPNHTTPRRTRRRHVRVLPRRHHPRPTGTACCMGPGRARETQEAPTPQRHCLF